jgi:hypothetical protein
MGAAAKCQLILARALRAYPAGRLRARTAEKTCHEFHDFFSLAGQGFAPFGERDGKRSVPISSRPISRYRSFVLIREIRGKSSSLLSSRLLEGSPWLPRSWKSGI